MSPTTERGNVVQVELAVQHPACWVIEVSDETEADVLGRQINQTSDRRANCHVTLVADKKREVGEAVEVVDSSQYTFSIGEMPTGVRPSAKGNATKDLLIEHDPRTQVSHDFTSRGFVYAAPVDVRDGIEYWTLLTTRSRRAIAEALDEIRDERAATIDLVSLTDISGRVEGELPLFRLSPRQREVFQLARKEGYYRQPKRATAPELAAELGITTSTFHEHLHRAEEKLLDRSAGV